MREISDEIWRERCTEAVKKRGFKILEGQERNQLLYLTPEHGLHLLGLLKPASIDSLPLDALVQILCKLNHDELKPFLSVSKSFHNAALMAQQSHFDFSTPAPKKKTMAFPRTKDMDATPAAPAVKLESRKPRASKLSEEETRKIAVVLFPVADCKRGLHSEWRSCGAAPRFEQSVVHYPTHMLNPMEPLS